MESCVKVTECISDMEIIAWKVGVKRGMHILYGDHRIESCVKVSECISDMEIIVWKVVLKLRNAYLIWKSSSGKWC